MGSKKEIDINFVVAHSAEARPLIDYYKLVKNNQHPGFNLYENNQTRLIVSGEGKLNAAAATAYLAGVYRLKAASGLWVNIGVAGHPNHTIGSLWRVNKITDENSARSIYPVALQGSRRSGVYIAGCALMTVALPTSTYSRQCLYDMEAVGFYQTALRFTTLEFILSFKVVSDNLKYPASEMDKTATIDLLQSQMAEVDQYLQSLKFLVYIKKCEQLIDINNIKLTYAQKEILAELITSLKIHGLNYADLISQAKDARQLIESLRQKLKSVELVC